MKTNPIAAYNGNDTGPWDHLFATSMHNH